MESIETIARTAVKGSTLIFAGNFISTLLRAITSIIIGRLVGPEGYGLYTLSLTPSSLLLLASDFGVNAALIKYTSNCKENKEEVVSTGLTFQSVWGLFLSLVLYLYAAPLSVYVINRPEAEHLVRVTSALIISQILFNTINCIFVGFMMFERSSYLTVLEAALKLTITFILLMLGLGVYGAIVGHVTSYLLAVLITVPLLLKCSLNLKIRLKISVLKMMLIFGIPLYLSGLLSGLLNVYRNHLFSIYISDAEIGSFTVALALSNVILVFASPISIVLFPQFSKIGGDKPYLIKSLFKSSIKYTSLLILPIVTFMIFFSRDIVYLFYGSRYVTSPQYLAIVSLQYFLVGLGMVTLGSLLSGLGDTNAILKSGLIAFTLSIISYPIAVKYYSVVGVIAVMLIASTTSVVYLLLHSIKAYGVEIDLRNTSRIYASSLISATLVWILRTFLDFKKTYINVVVFGVAFVILYAFILPIFKAINEEDVEQLDRIFKNIEALYFLLKVPLNIERRILRLFTR
ncbi:MAG: oligosaccharide flippase family protein [Candidatus Geothermarchaeota archaeon]